jgi:hypothetical protein
MNSLSERAREAFDFNTSPMDPIEDFIRGSKWVFSMKEFNNLQRAFSRWSNGVGSIKVLEESIEEILKLKEQASTAVSEKK